jgi:hypothetical protein
MACKVPWHIREARRKRMEVRLRSQRARRRRAARMERERLMKLTSGQLERELRRRLKGCRRDTRNEIIQGALLMAKMTPTERKKLFEMTRVARTAKGAPTRSTRRRPAIRQLEW